MKRWHYTVDWTLTHHVARRAVRGWGRVTGRGGADLGRVLAVAAGVALAWEGTMRLGDPLMSNVPRWVVYMLVVSRLVGGPIWASCVLRHVRYLTAAPPAARIVVFMERSRRRAQLLSAAGIGVCLTVVQHLLITNVAIEMDMGGTRWPVGSAAITAFVLAEQCAFFTGGGTPIWRAALDRLRGTLTIQRPARQPS